MKKMLFIISLLIVAAGCSHKVKEKIGLTTTAPNEFQVKRYKPLEVPPHYDLNEPTAQRSKDTADETTNKGKLSKTEKALLQDIEE